MAHPNAESFRRGYEAFGQGDLDTLRDLMAPDCVWHVGGDSPLSGDYEGTDEILGFFGRIAQESGGTFNTEAHDILANDEHGVALTETTAERNGKRLVQRSVHVVHFDDGKLSESWFFSEDQAAVDDFWS